MKVREIVGRACEDTLAQHGFVPDPIEDPADQMEGELFLVCIQYSETHP